MKTRVTYHAVTLMGLMACLAPVLSEASLVFEPGSGGQSDEIDEYTSPLYGWDPDVDSEPPKEPSEPLNGTVFLRQLVFNGSCSSDPSLSMLIGVAGDCEIMRGTENGYMTVESCEEGSYAYLFAGRSAATACANNTSPIAEVELGACWHSSVSRSNDTYVITKCEAVERTVTVLLYGTQDCTGEMLASAPLAIGACDGGGVFVVDDAAAGEAEELRAYDTSEASCASFDLSDRGDWTEVQLGFEEDGVTPMFALPLDECIQVGMASILVSTNYTANATDTTDSEYEYETLEGERRRRLRGVEKVDVAALLPDWARKLLVD